MFIQRLFTVLLTLAISLAYGQNSVDSLLNLLDQTIEKRQVYIEQKEQQINALRLKLEKHGISPAEVYHLNNQLFEEYKVYRFDSALHYVYTNMELARSLQNQEWVDETKLNLSIVLTSTGMYKESIDNLQSIDDQQLPSSLLKRYFVENKLVYEAMHSYALDEKYAPEYYFRAKRYQDSLLQVLSPASVDYVLELGLIRKEDDQLLQAEKIYLDICQNRLAPDTALYAKATATLADIYEQQGETLLQKKYLILSAITDIKTVVKENASLTTLATVLYQEGQIERANRYIEYALEDANFYNARLRKIEISKAYPIINGAYQLQNEKQTNALRFSITIITAISLLLFIALAYIFMQMRKLSRARRELFELNQELQQVNAQLKKLNQKLLETNNELQDANKQLHETNQQLNASNHKLYEANYIKEEYIGHFLNQCSVYIDKLENYQKIVRKKVLTKQLDQLLKMTEPEELLKAELKEFYINFDTAFLHIYPNFVEEFNALLHKDKRIDLKSSELLTTELRIFALIRLGISDSYKIASFLRYSPNTIYNYRAQIKNKSFVERDQFEQYVMGIGSFDNGLD